MKINKFFKCVGIIIGVFLLFFLWACSKGKDVEQIIESDNSKEKDDIPTEKEEDKETIYIQLCGAVVNPGIYDCLKGDYLFSVIEKAGGLTQEACFESVNQAQLVTDGQMVKVYTKEEEKLIHSGEMYSEIDFDHINKKVNINTADATTLMTLSGVGEAKAAQIIKYRQKNGSFTKIEDIMNISGIKERLFETIKDGICVN